MDQANGLVLDTSVVIPWVFADEDSDVAEITLGLLRAGFALVPSLWHLEVSNALRTARRRERISAAEADDFLRDVERLDIRTDVILPNARRLLAESQQFGLTAYDTAYLILARDRGLPLATLDSKLAEAAARAGVPLVA